MGKRHEGMKTALGGGSQHREKDVNDSRGKRINNAGLPLSLHPSVPLSLSPPIHSLYPLPPHPLVYFSLILFYLLYSPLTCPLCCQVTDLTSRGSSPHQASAAVSHFPSVLSCCVQVSECAPTVSLFKENVDDEVK